MVFSRRAATPDFEGGNYFDLFLIAAIATIADPWFSWLGGSFRSSSSSGT